MKSVLSISSLNEKEAFSEEIRLEAIDFLESGKILCLPSLHFHINNNEFPLLKEKKLSVKSIKYNLKDNKIWGVSKEDMDTIEIARNLIKRYTIFCLLLIDNLLPSYQTSLIVGNASLRPIKAEGRKQSKRQDDTRLHIDAFPSRPMHGKRLLRVFTNINQENLPRVWNVGEPFEKIAKEFLPKIRPPLPLSAKILQALKITKTKRTLYDHYMLKLHDSMKLSDKYQINSPKEVLNLPAGCIWVCYSDIIPHAVLSGSGLLEQTFYIPVEGMKFPEKSPLRILEKLTSKNLV
jgi:hypothetical protein